MRRVLRFAALLLATLGSLAGAEGWFRAQEAKTALSFPWDEPGRRYALKPAGQGINPDGFNERDLPLAKPDGVWRVVIVGDSVTFGGGLKREETYPRVAEAILRGSGVEAELINCAVYGYDAEQVAATLKYRGWRYSPDLVLYAAYTNDGDPTRVMQLGASGAPIFVGEPSSPGLGVLLRGSALARRVMGAVAARQDAGKLVPESEFRGRLDRAVSAMASDAAAHGVPLLVWGLVAHVLADPDPETCGKEDLGPGFCADQLSRLRMIGELSQAHGVPFAHILPALRAGTERAFYPAHRDPHHPNAAGHARIGALLAEALLAWREGRFAELPYAAPPEAMAPSMPGPAVPEPPERPKKGAKPPKNPRGEPRPRSGAPAPGP